MRSDFALNSSCKSDEFTDFDVLSTPQTTRGEPCTARAVGLSLSFEELVKRNESYGASSMACFGTTVV